LFFSIFNAAFSQDYLEVIPQKGDGIVTLLKKYNLPIDSLYIKKFISLNRKNLGKKDQLITQRKYELPILLLVFDGTSIRSSLGIKDYDLAKKIQDYNNIVTNKGLKRNSYKSDNTLWVPFHFLDEADLAEKKSKKETLIAKKQKESIVKENDITTNDDNNQEVQLKNKKGLSKHQFNKNLFGPSYKKVPKVDNRLAGYIFYLDPGHGGPDPGAIGNKDGHELTEDEYAYDVTLRLAWRLMQFGATVFMVVIDSTDGIRDDAFLKNNTNEYFGNGKLITGDQKERLQGRIDFINSLTPLYPQKKQRLIVIHVDSRVTEQRIDIFFYHKPGDSLSKRYAENLMDMISKKYNISQPGRGYSGNVSERNLYMLRHSPVISVYIELGNLQNPKDQLRFIDKNNRQAIANWLCDGILQNEKALNIKSPKSNKSTKKQEIIKQSKNKSHQKIQRKNK
jgi:N-acetylmuramoyl-L-alanine amidase